MGDIFGPQSYYMYHDPRLSAPVPQPLGGHDDWYTYGVFDHGYAVPRYVRDEPHGLGEEPACFDPAKAAKVYAPIVQKLLAKVHLGGQIGTLGDRIPLAVIERALALGFQKGFQVAQRGAAQFKSWLKSQIVDPVVNNVPLLKDIPSFMVDVVTAGACRSGISQCIVDKVATELWGDFQQVKICAPDAPPPPPPPEAPVPPSPPQEVLPYKPKVTQMSLETLQKLRERAGETSLHAKPITAIELQYPVAKAEETSNVMPLLAAAAVAFLILK